MVLFLKYYQEITNRTMASDKNEVERLRRAGYRVGYHSGFIQVSVRLHGPTLNRFRKSVEQLNYKMQDALTEALEIWMEKNAPPKDKKD